jgi:RNA polymerase sigma-70 factor (ECF subfamily)
MSIMLPTGCDTDELVGRAAAGDAQAVGELLDRHRGRLRQMVSVRMDPRVSVRVDPSDIVQEALAEAFQKLPEYLRWQPLPFYPWLRKIAWERLVQVHDQHVRARKRSVDREDRRELPLPEQSAVQLAEQLVTSGTSPSEGMARDEMRERLQKAIGQLENHHREVVIMRNLEQLRFTDIAAVLGITEAATRSRYRRAVDRLHNLLTRDS